jgi:hypothetical protein
MTVVVNARETAGSGRFVRFSSAHVFRPPQRDGAIVGAAAGGVAALLGLALIALGIARGVRFATFSGDVLGVLLLAGGAILLYWSYALYELRYVVDDDSLTILWGLTRVIIPVTQIDRIILGRRYGEPRVRGISWPGSQVGRARVARLGDVLFFSAHRSSADIVYVITPESTFGLSIGDPQGFARAIQASQETSASDFVPIVARYNLPPGTGILRDPRAMALLGAATLAFLVAAGYIYGRFQALPAHLTIDYLSAGGVQHIGSRGELLLLPLTALIWLLIGAGVAAWSHARYRSASYALLLGTMFVECLYAVAAVAAAH